MNILIIARLFHQENRAIAIQIRRHIHALLEYTDHNITLITEGINEICVNSDRFEIINIPKEQTRFSFFPRLIDRLICNYVLVRTSTFVSNGTIAADRVMSKANQDILLTVSTPIESHIIGFNIKKKYLSLKWIPFFIDPWPMGILPIPYYQFKLFAKVEFGFMQTIIKNCDGLLTLVKYSEDIIRKRFLTNKQFGVIPLCINTEYYKRNHQIDTYIIHSGTLQKERMRISLFEAIKEIASEDNRFKGLIQQGRVSREFRKYFKKSKCKDITIMNALPVELASKIHGLFKIGIIIEAPMQETNPFIPSKITDCLQLNERIIAITPPNSFLRDFANQNEGIFCCSYEKSEIKECIKEVLNSEKRIQPETLKDFQPSNVALTYDRFFNLLKM